MDLQIRKRIRTHLLFLCLPLLIIVNSGAAQNPINVDLLTGTATVTIPVYTLSVGDLSSPVALSYRASGLKVQDYDNSVGIGWRLIASGQISREVRGFPDDMEIQNDASYGTIKGWLRPSNSAPALAQSFAKASGGSTSCADEISDANNISANFPYTLDAEPDLFTVSAPGLNCSFVFDASASHLIKTIPYRDYKFFYSTNPSTGRIVSFTVINEKGIKYYFDKGSMVNHYINALYNGGASEISPSSLEVFKSDFIKYRTKTTQYLNYDEAWMLTKMEDTKGNTISYEYTATILPNLNYKLDKEIKAVQIIKPDGSGGFINKPLYTVIKWRTYYKLKTIVSHLASSDIGNVSDISFGWSSDGQNSSDKRLTSISLEREKINYTPIYTKRFTGPSEVYSWYFLKGLQMAHANCSTGSSQYDFTYNSVDEPTNTCYCTPLNGTVVMDSITNQQDYWGYYNGAIHNESLEPTIWVYAANSAVETFKNYPIPGYSGSDQVQIPTTSYVDRSVNVHAIDGTIKRITLPAGGVAELEYENNDFYDKDIPSISQMGGGIRVKKITFNDGLNTNEITNYSYIDPATGVSSGRAISVPKFTIPFDNSSSYPNLTEAVKNSIYRTTYDLNNEAEDILYKVVTVSKVGAGKSVHEFDVSGTYGSSPSTYWQETNNYIVRTNLSGPSPCVSIAPSFLNAGSLKYPFSNHPNFDFQRGLPLLVTQYTDAGDKLLSETYTYQKSHTNPSFVYGLHIDDIGNNVTGFGKYNINTVFDNFLIQKTTTNYNQPNPAPYNSSIRQDVEIYDFTPNNSTLPYRVLTAVRKINSDGVTVKSTFKYAKDYTTTASGTGDDMDKSLYYFINNNNNVLIETAQSRVISGVETYLGGSLNTFKYYPYSVFASGGRYLPFRSYEFVNQSGAASFTPSSDASGVFSWDLTNYVNPPTTIENYNDNGLPKLITNNSRQPKTIFAPTYYETKAAEFTNALPENVRFLNGDIIGPESATESFSIGGNTFNQPGHASNSCLNFQNGTILSAQFTKAAFGRNIIISFWSKNSGSIQNMRIKLTKQDGTNLYDNSNLKVLPGDNWLYNQFLIPSPSATGVLIVYIYNIGTTPYSIDDLLLYPDNTAVTTYNYTTNSSLGTNLLTGKFGVNGIGNVFEYDAAARPWLVRDQFYNITEMKKYKNKNNWAQLSTVLPIHFANSLYPFTSDYRVELNVPVNFDVSLYPLPSDCTPSDNILYTWDFGDGTPIVQTTVGYTTHTYTTLNQFQASVTITSPGLNTLFLQTPPVTNTVAPFPITVLSSPPPPPPPGGGGTPVICSAGIIQLSESGDCTLSNCGGMPSDCSHTYFMISSITGGSLSNVVEVTWETADLSATNWITFSISTTAANNFQTVVPFHPVHTGSYLMRAKVKYADNTSAYSGTITVLNEN